MNINQKDIDALNRYAAQLIGGGNVSKEDIVNSALLKVLEVGGSLLDVKKEIREAYFNEVHSSQTPETYKAFGNHEASRFCKGCNQDVPISGFRVYRYKKINKEILSHICKKCLSKYYVQRRKNLEPEKKQILNQKERQSMKDKRVIKRYMSKPYIKTAHLCLGISYSEE